ncbi:MAG: 50S ribosomal protein L35 [Ignavibacteriales bacterium]
MPKLKTHRGAAKRIRFTGSGKVRRMKAGKTHKLEVKTAKRKRALRTATIASKQDTERARRLLPYR